MKNITFSADEDVIGAARARAQAAGTTLNEAFRRWLGEYAAARKTGTGTLPVHESGAAYVPAAATGPAAAEDGLRADPRLLRAARAKAAAEDSTLDRRFAQWLEEYTGEQDPVEAAMRAVDRMRSYASTGGRKFTRDEMNER